MSSKQSLFSKNLEKLKSVLDRSCSLPSQQETRSEDTSMQNQLPIAKRQRLNDTSMNKNGSNNNMCLTCKGSKPANKFYAGYSQTCKQCLQKTELPCSCCKEVKIWTRFPLNKEKNGPDKVCHACRHAQNQTQNCLTCKESKPAKQFYVYNSKTCKKCMLKTMLTCSWCKETKRYDTFQIIDKNNGPSKACIACLSQIPHKAKCLTCKESKKLERFYFFNYNTCKQCLVKTKLTCSLCKVERLFPYFNRMNKSPGRSNVCNPCHGLKKNVASSVKNTRAKCLTCKETKKLGRYYSYNYDTCKHCLGKTELTCSLCKEVKLFPYFNRMNKPPGKLCNRCYDTNSSLEYRAKCTTSLSDEDTSMVHKSNATDTVEKRHIESHTKEPSSFNWQRDIVEANDAQYSDTLAAAQEYAPWLEDFKDFEFIVL